MWRTLRAAPAGNVLAPDTSWPSLRGCDLARTLCDRAAGKRPRPCASAAVSGCSAGSAPCRTLQRGGLRGTGRSSAVIPAAAILLLVRSVFACAPPPRSASSLPDASFRRSAALPRVPRLCFAAFPSVTAKLCAVPLRGYPLCRRGDGAALFSLCGLRQFVFARGPAALPNSAFRFSAEPILSIRGTRLVSVSAFSPPSPRRPCLPGASPFVRGSWQCAVVAGFPTGSSNVPISRGTRTSTAMLSSAARRP